MHDLREEAPEFEACLLVDRGGDALDAAATSHATNVRLTDAVDIVPEDLSMSESACCCRRVARTRKTILPVPLRTRLAQAETLPSVTTSTYTSDRRLSASGLHNSGTARRHVCCVFWIVCFGVDMF